MAKVECVYTSASANPLPHNLDWSKTGFVAFGSCNSIVLCRSDLLRAVNTLVGHLQRVNCVKWVRDFSDGGDQDLVSGSCDKKVKVWTKDGADYVLAQTLEGHDEAVNVVDALRFVEGSSARTLIASTGTDATVRIWQKTRDNESFSPTCLLKLHHTFSLALHWTLAPGTSSKPLVFVAGDDSNAHVFAEEKDGNFIKVQTLSGHEDWVRGLDVARRSDELLIATGGQDALVRLWTLKEWREDELDPNDIRLKAHCFSLGSGEAAKKFGVVLESVLVGHENSIYGVCWDAKGKTLLTASMDKTVILWNQDSVSGLWMDDVRVGEVGGNTLGFYGGLFSPMDDAFLGYDYQGAIHLWKRHEDTWRPRFVLGGHFRSVEDVAWDPFDGGYGIFSVSLDQTTRLHAPWKTEIREDSTWQEIARPQIHGYDMTCVAAIAPGFAIVSGAEEKLLRIFRAPLNFLENVQELSTVRVDEERKRQAGKIAIGAAVPALGLSNKAIVDETCNTNLEDERIIQPHPSEQFGKGHVFHRISLHEPPLETDLLQNTLWPEVHKLYGHGNEVFCVASSIDGTIVASACKASQPDQASILLWTSTTWRNIGSVNAHSLTVTQMAFSRTSDATSGHLLLSVSRDRTLAVTQVIFGLDENSFNFETLFKTDKRTCIHGRIIWACDWSYDDSFFVTSSRDKKVIAWRRQGSSFSSVQPALSLPDSCTAVACAPNNIPVGDEHAHLIAVGLDDGRIFLHSFDPFTGHFSELFRFSVNMSHHLTVKRLSFRPKCRTAETKDSDKNLFQLASCGADTHVRIYNIFLLN